MNIWIIQCRRKNVQPSKTSPYIVVEYLRSDVMEIRVDNALRMNVICKMMGELLYITAHCSDDDNLQ